VLPAVACVIVNSCDEYFIPDDAWAMRHIHIPVLTLPLTIGGGMFARHGATQVTFSYNVAVSGAGATAPPAAAALGVSSSVGAAGAVRRCCLLLCITCSPHKISAETRFCGPV
jgi:hypothetical protein